VGLAEQISYRHSYTICCSVHNWRPVRMRRAAGSPKPGVHEFTLRIGLAGHEEFHFLRDGDKHQMIYPAKDRSLTRDVPVRGPDHLGEGKNWSIVGETGDTVTLQLQVWEGDISLTAVHSSQGSKTFKSLRGHFRRKYFVYAQWTNWGFTAMTPDESGSPGVYRSTMKMPAAGVQSFQIVVDENIHQALYPELAFTDQLVAEVRGPDARGPDLCWALSAPPGSLVEIKLDLLAEDRRERVTWDILEERLVSPSGLLTISEE